MDEERWIKEGGWRKGGGEKGDERRSMRRGG